MKIKLFLVCLIGLFMFTACGKMSHPDPIPGSGYPHTYPRH